MDSLRDPLASPHPPANDRQVVEVVAVMLGDGCQRIMGCKKHTWPQGCEWWWSWRWSWCQTSHITAEGTKTTTTTVITITIHLTTDSRESHHRHHHVPFSNPPTSRVTRSVINTMNRPNVASRLDPHHHHTLRGRRRYWRGWLRHQEDAVCGQCGRTRA